MPQIFHFFKHRSNYKGTADDDEVKGGKILSDIVSVLCEHPDLYGSIDADLGIRERAQKAVLEILKLGRALFTWASAKRGKMDGPFTEHAFIFANLVHLYGIFYKACFKCDAPPEHVLEIPENLIDENAAKRGDFIHDGFCFVEEKYWRDWKDAVDEREYDAKLREIKVASFVHDITELEKEANSKA